MATYNSIRVPGRGGGGDGSLRVDATGLSWRKQMAGGGGARVVAVETERIDSIDWVRLNVKAYMLVVRMKDEEEPPVRFVGFRESDKTGLAELLGGVRLDDVDVTAAGHSWGELRLAGERTLEFSAGGQRAFELALSDVSKVTVPRTNTDVELEFHHDDTAQERDSLIMASFHVPLENAYVDGEDDYSPAAVLAKIVSERADIGQGDNGSPIAVFEAGCLVPRGRFTVEMYQGFMRLLGATAEFKVQYSSLYRMFILPKASNMTQTYCIMSLDPPIRKGLTHYPHVMFLFNDKDTLHTELDVEDEVFDAINEKNGNKLERSYEGPLWEVFGKCLRGLSGSKLTRLGSFRSHNDGPAVRCSMKADQGYLYTLEKCFFYLEKPPTLIPYEDVAYAEFTAFGGAARTIDLNVSLKEDNTVYQFRGIAKEEHGNLSDFLSERNVKVVEPQGYVFHVLISPRTSSQKFITSACIPVERTCVCVCVCDDVHTYTYIGTHALTNVDDLTYARIIFSLSLCACCVHRSFACVL